MLTGKGRAFSAGGDIRWFQDLTPPLDALFTEARKTIVDLLEVQQPIIAAVSRPATGPGATIALFSDVIESSRNNGTCYVMRPIPWNASSLEYRRRFDLDQFAESRVAVERALLHPRGESALLGALVGDLRTGS